MTCEGCGLPDDVCPGIKLHITTKTRPDDMQLNRPRDKTATVWVCGQFCAWQTLAIAAMGKDTSKWPIRLNEFVSANPQLLERSRIDSTVTKCATETIENIVGFKGQKKRLIYQDDKPIFVTQDRGRKRIHKNNADRQRAYRNNKLDNATGK